MSVEHNTLGGSANMHSSYRWLPANEAAKYALSVTASDKGKIAWQTDNNTLWMLIDNTQSTNSSGWISMGCPQFTKELTIAAGVGPNTGVVNIPVPADGLTYVRIRATGVDQTSAKIVGVNDFVEVRRTSGTLDYPFGSFEAHVVPESGSGWDTTWYVRDLNSPSIRLTLKGDVSNIVKWRVEADFRPMPFPS